MAGLLTADALRYSYGRTTVLDGVSLDVPAGSVQGLIGPNGSGKTTLLRCLYGALRPHRGSVTLDGVGLTSMSARSISRRIAVVAQESAEEMPLAVEDAVSLGRIPHRGMFARSSHRDREVTEQALERVGLRHMARRSTAELSGGERQRMMIARALAQEPAAMLLDEPTNHLDIGYQHEVLHLVRSIGVTAVVVLHDLNLAARYCDALMLLADGRVRAQGAPAEVLGSDLLEDVYDVGVERHTAEDSTAQLLFRRQTRGSKERV
ncbi:MAG TPA: ABC transporter ATP-binding protein [Candidatus Nesterenkonia stercoripullorum]|uniref:ABC transporter ATP-binding protein n=1 Tax=Candidatus Nesterenkonia stercoripullorum TaxID=2838701 RepID=A0A9D2A8R4_9MICC|nr:ABC transporter ATP-binding protein [Candidatus Nesterenkonia stercoripullorum]